MQNLSRYSSHTFFIASSSIIFYFTKDITFLPYGRILEIITFGMLLVCTFMLKKGLNLDQNSKSVFFLLALCILFLVGITGWMNSSFFFLVYLLALIVGLVFPLSVFLAFLTTLVFLFTLSISLDNFAFEMLRILSFLTIIPISYYMRKEYLKLKESQKDILILREELGKNTGSVDKLLQNKVITLGTSLRESVNDIKQVAFLLRDKSSEEGVIRKTEEIIALSNAAIQKVNTFEQSATGEKITKTVSPQNS